MVVGVKIMNDKSFWEWLKERNWHEIWIVARIVFLFLTSIFGTVFVFVIDILVSPVLLLLLIFPIFAFLYGLYLCEEKL